MSLVTLLKCVACGKEFPPAAGWTCPTCGPDEGILDVQYDMPRVRQTLTRAALSIRPLSHWRYAELLPIDVPPPAGIEHIGWTPLIEAPRLAAALGIERLRLKDDGRSASASFKDRASSIGVAHAIEMHRGTGVSPVEIACASTGNAASSLAYCAAAAGLGCNIFVPRTVPEGKLAQLLAYGARVFKVMGSYAEAYDLCTHACARFGWYNRNCAVNPYLVEGKKTGGLEVAEQCADDPPEWVAVSIGDGCTISGIYKGLRQSREAGIISWNARMLGVQSEGVAPIANLWQRRNAGEWLEKLTGRDLHSRDTTYADSINCPVPRNWRKALAALRDSDGACVAVTDEQIMEAVRTAGRLSGVFAEPAAAAAVAGIAQARRDGILTERSNVVAMITGNGLKDTAGALRAVGKPHEVPPDVGEVERIIRQE
ncbi:MAG: threonine synthase [Phycisphaerae bacterium]|nr:MAG: threonine synthase [Planctomycetia bacterium]RIK71368.1 MAG: threonine synthase [Planctomycetota bacterium]GJQ26489.1 MAG: threonine synthase [Phycisphaerae bacterium]